MKTEVYQELVLRKYSLRRPVSLLLEMPSLKTKPEGFTSHLCLFWAQLNTPLPIIRLHCDFDSSSLSS